MAALVCHQYQILSAHSKVTWLPHFFLTSNLLGDEHRRLYLSHAVTKTLSWWHTRLKDHLAFRQLHPLPYAKDIGIFVDASTSWGIGIIIDNYWWSIPLSAGWKQPGRDICWLEAVALELLFYFLHQLGHENVQLVIHSDSNGAIGAHSKGRSKNFEINLCVRRTYAISSSLLIFPQFSYIESSLNPADRISRGDMYLPISTRLRRCFEIPVDLISSFIWYDE
jgi:hypothetical protein